MTQRRHVRHRLLVPGTRPVVQRKGAPEMRNKHVHSSHTRTHKRHKHTHTHTRTHAHTHTCARAHTQRTHTRTHTAHTRTHARAGCTTQRTHTAHTHSAHTQRTHTAHTHSAHIHTHTHTHTQSSVSPPSAPEQRRWAGWTPPSHCPTPHCRSGAAPAPGTASAARRASRAGRSAPMTVPHRKWGCQLLTRMHMHTRTHTHTHTHTHSVHLRWQAIPAAAKLC